MWRSHGTFFVVLSTLFPMTAPRIPPTAAPMTPPFTLFLLVPAPMIAPAAAPMAASRLVCFTTTVRGALRVPVPRVALDRLAVDVRRAGAEVRDVAAPAYAAAPAARSDAERLSSGW